MTRDLARQILFLHRPWMNEPVDAETAEALALVQQDAELRAWFENHCALQLAVRDSFRAQTAPEAFREQIISECLARSRSVSRRSLLVGGAAVLLLGAVGFEAYVLFGNREPGEEITFAAYERRMSREALRLYRMDKETSDLSEIRTFLAQQQSPADYTLPAAVAGMKATGCVATKWQGRAVSMICFHTGKPLPAGHVGDSDLFLFVIARKELPDAPAANQPTFNQINRLTVARWTADGNTYLLASEHGEAFLKTAL